MPATQYETRNGINYAVGEDEKYAYCDRCGNRPIINDKCLKCDVPEPTADAKRLAEVLEFFCYHARSGAIPGCYDGRPESFDPVLAAKIIQACSDTVKVTQATNIGFE